VPPVAGQSTAIAGTGSPGGFPREPLVVAIVAFALVRCGGDTPEKVRREQSGWTLFRHAEKCALRLPFHREISAQLLILLPGSHCGRRQTWSWEHEPDAGIAFGFG
jgi:hypothetical protein